MPVKQQAGRFAVLRHDHPFLHWDLLLEDGAEAATWRLLRQPVFGEPIAAELLAPHRLMYLSYAGPVSGGRGHVSPLAAGTWQQLPAGNLSAAFNDLQPLLQIRLDGWQECAAAALCCTADNRCFWIFAEAADQRLMPT